MGMRINSPQKCAKINICFAFIQKEKNLCRFQVAHFIEELQFAEITQDWKSSFKLWQNL